MEFSDFIINVISGGLVGAIASYIASKQFQKINSIKNIPKIELSNQLIETQRKIEGKEYALQLKLVNHTDQSVSNIRIELEGFENLAPDGSIPLLSLTPIAKREVLYINKFDKNDKEFYHNAHRVNIYVPSSDILSEVKKFDWIRISVHAECPYYSTATVISNDYNVKKCILNNSHIFNTGNNTSIQSKS